MTGVTRHILVGAQKRIARMFLMIELPQIPGIGRMTGLALVPQSPPVMIIRLMAAGAGAFRAGKLVAQVAVLARDHAMQANQGKLGEVVIKTADGVPAIRDVAGGAHLHIGIFVRVVCSVTTGTIARQLILQSAHVATGTTQILVLSQQRKSDFFCMIKLSLFPLHRRMAAIALFAVTTQVYIVVCVTAVAGHGRVLLHHTIAVTGAARQFTVPVRQRKIRGVVVKNEGIPPVHRVAGIALLTIFTRMHISRFMAAHTGGFLELIPLPHMAAAARHLFV